jgi:hypothetical protein
MTIARLKANEPQRMHLMNPSLLWKQTIDNKDFSQAKASEIIQHQQ